MVLEKYRGNILKIEEIDPQTVYTFTIAPKDEMQFMGFKFNTLVRLKMFNEAWTRFLTMHLQPYAKYRLHTEVSPKGRLHYHGIIKICDIVGFYVTAVPCLLEKCMIEVDKITDRKKWDEYITKQSKYLKDYIVVNKGTDILTQILREKNTGSWDDHRIIQEKINVYIEEEEEYIQECIDLDGENQVIDNA